MRAFYLTPIIVPSGGSSGSGTSGGSSGSSGGGSGSSSSGTTCVQVATGCNGNSLTFVYLTLPSSWVSNIPCGSSS